MLKNLLKGLLHLGISAFIMMLGIAIAKIYCIMSKEVGLYAVREFFIMIVLAIGMALITILMGKNSIGIKIKNKPEIEPSKNDPIVNTGYNTVKEKAKNVNV